MGDTASWFYKTRLPEIASEHNCSLEEAEKLFMLSDHHKIRENNPEKYEDTYKRTPDMKEVEVELEEPVLFKLMLMAHENDITLNDLVGKALKDILKSDEYKFENGTKPGPQFLTEKV